jgi:hypothetical protein
MKLWGSMKQGANKLAFDAEKALRVKRQEGAISGLRDKVQAQYAGLGQTAYALMDEGAIAHPQLAQYANEIGRLQELIQAEAKKLAEMQAEEYESEESAAPSPTVEPPAEPTPAELSWEEPAAPPPPPAE